MMTAGLLVVEIVSRLASDHPPSVLQPFRKSKLSAHLDPKTPRPVASFDLIGIAIVKSGHEPGDISRMSQAVEICDRLRMPASRQVVDVDRDPSHQPFSRYMSSW